MEAVNSRAGHEHWQSCLMHRVFWYFSVNGQKPCAKSWIRNYLKCRATAQIVEHDLLCSNSRRFSPMGWAALNRRIFIKVSNSGPMERKLSIRKTRLRVSDPFSSGSSSEIFYQSRLGLTGRSEIVSPFAGAAGEYLRFSANSINSIDHLRLSKLSSISDSLPSVKVTLQT